VSNANAEQPPPSGGGEEVWPLVIAKWEASRDHANRDRVIADMRERDAIGRERYGTPLRASNGRDAILDAYQEALDLRVYLEQARAEGRLSYIACGALEIRVDQVIDSLAGKLPCSR
jgi:hypothetical protein